MQIILWGLAIYCAVQFLLFSGYVLEGLRYYIKNKPFSNLVLTLMYISAFIIMYSLAFDYVEIEDTNEPSKFWILFILKIGSIVISFGWFWLVGKAVLLEADKFTDRVLKR